MYGNKSVYPVHHLQSWIENKGFGVFKIVLGKIMFDRSTYQYRPNFVRQCA